MLYFGYGANTHHGQMSHRCPAATFLGTAELRDYRLAFRGVADVVRDPGSRVIGALWEIDHDDLKALDRFEGYPTLYQRGLLRVSPEPATRLPYLTEATVYWMVGQRGLGLPSEHYLQCLIEGYSDCALPRSQLEQALVFSADQSGQARPYQSRQWEARP